MPKQQLLELPIAPTYTREDFIISSCNKHAYDLVTSWPNWPSHALIICGEQYSGKTHLAHIWQKLSHAISQRASALSFTPNVTSVVIDIDQLPKSDQATLFHIYNFTRENQGWLLMTSSTPIGQLGIELRDLQSRLEATPVIHLGAPDETVLHGVLIKMLSDRQLTIRPDVADYILSRIPRSFETLHRLVEHLDAESMANKHSITIPFVRKILPKLNLLLTPQ